MLRCIKRGRCQSSADSGKRRNPAEWPEDEGAGRADVHHYCHRPAWSCLSGQNPEAGAKGVSAAAGLYDWQIDRIEQETSDSQLYKQAGNGVTVNVIEAIGTLLRQADAEIRAEDEKTKR